MNAGEYLPLSLKELSITDKTTRVFLGDHFRDVTKGRPLWLCFTTYFFIWIKLISDTLITDYSRQSFVSFERTTHSKPH